MTRPAARALEHGLLIVTPAVVTVMLLSWTATGERFAYDFHHFYWPGGDRILHGLTPYAHGAWYPAEPAVGMVYPAPAGLLFALFALVPRGVGDVAFTALCAAAALLALRTLGVRDWRPYGVVMLWPPFISGWQTANVSMLLLLGIALLWRARSRPVPAGLLLAAMVSLKLFLWPLAIFLLATRRMRAVAWAAAGFVAISAASWAVLGFDEISRYRTVLREFAPLRADDGHGLIGLLERFGAAPTAAYAVALPLAVLAAAACLPVARRGLEAEAFVLALAASLLATPILWLHYLVLLAVPLALRHPRLHPMWLAPLALWAAVPIHPSAGQVAFALLVCTAVFAEPLAARRAGATPSPAPLARPR